MKFVRNAARNFGVARELVSFFWRKRWAGGPFKPFFGLSGDAPGVKEPTLVAKNATRMGHPPGIPPHNGLRVDAHKWGNPNGFGYTIAGGWPARGGESPKAKRSYYAE
jgi:hypothetical protein